MPIAPLPFAVERHCGGPVLSKGLERKLRQLRYSMRLSPVFAKHWLVLGAMAQVVRSNKSGERHNSHFASS